MVITPVLAAISGSALMTMVIWIIVAAVICWILWWLIGYVGLPEPFNKIARVIVAVIAAIICINALLTLVGKPFINW